MNYHCLGLTTLWLPQREREKSIFSSSYRHLSLKNSWIQLSPFPYWPSLLIHGTEIGDQARGEKREQEQLFPLCGSKKSYKLNMKLPLFGPNHPTQNTCKRFFFVCLRKKNIILKYINLKCILSLCSSILFWSQVHVYFGVSPTQSRTRDLWMKVE